VGTWNDDIFWFDFSCSPECNLHIRLAQREEKEEAEKSKKEKMEQFDRNTRRTGVSVFDCGHSFLLCLLWNKSI
jgi:hypothetical protein